MFSTGFTMNSSIADQRGEVLVWMQNMATNFKFALVGSAMVGEKDKNYNRLYFVEPSGKYYVYDKKHLFRMAMESDHYTAGRERLILEYCGWKICPMVCYDLRFPGWSRNQPIDKKGIEPVYDLLIYVANWPERRSAAWKTLIGARAIENYCYSIGVNRVGEDGNQIHYSGNSAVVDPTGNKLIETTENKEEFPMVDLDLNYLKKFREQFPAFKDADDLLLGQ